jgi:hypothetical protein
MAGVSRRTRIALAALGVVVFLGASAALARFLTVENRERHELVELLRHQARGDADGMLDRLAGCRADPDCRREVRTNASRLRRPGRVQILNLRSGTSYTLTGATGKTRVAWRVPGRLPVVQCALVRRKGNVVAGLSVTLLRLGPPIGGTADC